MSLCIIFKYFSDAQSSQHSCFFPTFTTICQQQFRIEQSFQSNLSESRNLRTHYTAASKMQHNPPLQHRYHAQGCKSIKTVPGCPFESFPDLRDLWFRDSAVRACENESLSHFPVATVSVWVFLLVCLGAALLLPRIQAGGGVVKMTLLSFRFENSLSKQKCNPRREWKLRESKEGKLKKL